MDIKSLEKYSENNPKLADLIMVLPQELLNVSSIIGLGKNAVLVQRNDPVEYGYILLKGKLSAFNQTFDGKFSVLAAMYPPEVVSDLEVLAEKDSFAANVMADEESELLIYPVALFRQVLFEDLPFLLKISQMQARKSFHISNLRGQQALYGSTEKIVSYLVQYCAEHQPTPKREIGVDVTRQQLASQMVIGIKTLYRGLIRLQDQGYITVRRGRIRISYSQYQRLLKRWKELLY